MPCRVVSVGRSVADSLFRPHPEQRARASREPQQKNFRNEAIEVWNLQHDGDDEDVVDHDEILVRFSSELGLLLLLNSYRGVDLWYLIGSNRLAFMSCKGCCLVSLSIEHYSSWLLVLIFRISKCASIIFDQNGAKTSHRAKLFLKEST